MSLPATCEEGSSGGAETFSRGRGARKEFASPISPSESVSVGSGVALDPGPHARNVGPSLARSALSCWSHPGQVHVFSGQ